MPRNSSKINALIKGISTRSAKQRVDVQEALVECAMFVFEDRNTDPAIRLFKAIGGETHRAGMSKWLSLNAPVHFVKDSVCLSSDRQKELAGSMTPSEFEAQIRAMPAWYDMDEANNKPQNVWDSVLVLKNEDAHLSKLVQKAIKNGDEIVAEKLNEARMVLAAFLNDAAYEVKEEVIAE